MYEFVFNIEKNIKLIQERNISFEDIICLIHEDKVVDIISHYSERYSNQEIYLIDVDGYLYLVPFEREGNKIHLKTIFPSRKYTKLYNKEVKNE